MSYSVQNPTAEALLAHADWAHALARQLVQDVAAADDVVQEAWLAALRSPPDTGGPMRPWLATVLRNTAGQLRRRSASRSRREKAAARPEALPSAAELVEKAESQRGLVDKVLALPAPYRETILLRYFENASAADIARRLDVPAATVRWRLQKGLALLRELLDAERDGDQRAWAMALLPLARAPWAGLTGSSLKTLGAGSALAITGVLIVKKIVLPVAAIALLGLGVWVVAPSFAGAVPVESDTVAGPVAGGAVALEEKGEDLSADALVSRDRVVTEGTEGIAKPQPSIAVLVGRCVDEDGGPVSGCDLDLHLAARNLNAAGANQGPVLKASAVSAVDGSFEFRVEILSDTRYMLTALREGMLQTYGRLPDSLLASASQGSVDLGDIVLRRGARLRATIVDQTGAALSGVSLVAEIGIPSLDDRMPIHLQVGRSGPGGALRFRNDPLLMPGSWEIRSHESYEIISPKRLVVPADVSVFEERITVRSLTGDDAISGQVISENGEPQTKVEIAILRDGRAVRSVHSGENGSFRVYRQPDSQAEVVLRAVGDGELLSAYSESLSWGASGVELLMRRASSLDLTVVDDRGEAVEEFGVAMSWSEDPAANNRIEHKGRHPGGNLRLTGIGRAGRLALLVWPTTGDLAVPMPVNVALPENGSTSLSVTLPRRKSFTIRLRYPDGRPALASNVELVQANETGLSASTTVTPRESVMWNLNPRRKDWAVGFRLDQAETDAQGRAHLRGPDRDRVGLRITAEGHPPLIAYPIRPSETELELVVDAAAILSGLLLPTNLESRFRRDAAIPLSADHRPGLVLRRPGEREPINTPQGRVVPIAADGSFHVEGLPAGQFEVLLHWLKPMSRMSMQSVYLEPPLAIVKLVAGEAEMIQIDATDLLPGRLQGRVLWQGQSVAAESVRLTNRRTHNGRDVFDLIEGGETDKDGRFEMGALMPGAYSLSVRVMDENHGEAWLSAPDWVQVSAGHVSEAVFQVNGRAVRLLIRDGDGEPVIGRALRIVHEGMDRAWDRKTDAEGQVAISDAPLGRLRVMVLGPGMPMLPSNVRLVRPETELEAIQVREGSEELVVERVLR